MHSHNHIRKSFAASLESQVYFSSSKATVADSKDTFAASSYGQGLSKNELDLFSEQQMLQLFELYKEARKPADSTSNDLNSRKY